ncbi:MAG: peptidylprolyl isomerase [Candidatus Pacearchaeota archaeon]
MGSKHTKVALETTKGRIVLELYTGEMPITAGNFVKLVNDGFYDGIVFHRVIEGFMIQGGDPTGTGAGGPGYKIKDEFSGTDLDRNDRGTISMANAGPNTGGSQFFINVADNRFLDGKHPVFGRVTEGLEIVDEISQVKTDSQDRPVQEVKIISAKVI